MRFKRISSLAVFGRELLKNPGTVGAAVPSSRSLARRMASFVPANPRGYVVELGAGTGAVTTALLERGVPLERLVVVERSAPMIELLRSHFPHVEVIAGDAAQLGSLLKTHFGRNSSAVSHVVSSLPLRSLPKTVVADIARELKHLLPEEGRYIQFTYDLRRKTNPALEDFERVDSSLVLMNIPPARVDVFQVRRTGI